MKKKYKKKFPLSVIIPVFNESNKVNVYIYNIYRQLKKIKALDFEIIIIDDCSNNKTFSIIKNKLKIKKIRLFKNSRNLGPGKTINKGAILSKKEYIMWTGADNDANLNQYLKHISKLKKFELLVFYIKNIQVREITRIIFSFIFTKILNFSLFLNLPYYNGIILMNRKKYLDLNVKSERFFFSAEVKILSIKKKYKYINIPFYLKKTSQPNVRTVFNIKNWIDVIKNYIRILFQYYFK